MKTIWPTYILLNFILINKCYALEDFNKTIDYSTLISRLDYKKFIPHIINNTDLIGGDKIFYSIIALITVLFLIAMCVGFCTSLLIYYIYDNSKKKIIKSTMGIHAHV
ncbi:unknown similar to AMEV089 [Choristoneura biennis entomopoxvirus]|uniref:Uncharacterized protein n=1 Tax=Choristoneura biennis entomopoxvirus TaxID=10288 RepID=A0A916KPL5_CBEPV|nr:unknown similar to AMEV089 [Choristoneura biennis entomopoxvirus]CCU55714.1 unknown similar to AMEV089 [Choristoneura biennis entomopoxvirus]